MNRQGIKAPNTNKHKVTYLLHHKSTVNYSLKLNKLSSDEANYF